jgi:hypothetical protein
MYFCHFEVKHGQWTLVAHPMKLFLTVIKHRFEEIDFLFTQQFIKHLPKEIKPVVFRSEVKHWQWTLVALHEMIFARYHTSFPRNGLLVHTDRSVPRKDGERIPKRGVIIIFYLHRRNLSAFLWQTIGWKSCLEPI